MAVELVPEWMAGLEEEDLVFIKNLCCPPAPSKRWRDSTASPIPR